MNYSAVRGRTNTMTLGVIAAVVAIIIVIGAIFICNNSIGSNTSGDDTRPVVNNTPPAADINTVIPAASVNPRYKSSRPY